MKDMGNPFMEETGDLFTLDAKIIAHPRVAEICGDYHYHSVQREKTDSHTEKITSGHLL
jgi:hypothetical protein